MAFQDIRKSRKLLSPTDIGFVIGVIVFSVALLALNIYLARTLQGGEWLYIRWNGARAFLFEKTDAYGLPIAQQVQTLVYGREAFLEEYPYVVNDPFYIVLLYTPLAILNELFSIFSPSVAVFIDFSVARGIWMLFSEFALVGIVLFSVRLTEWKIPRWMFIVLIGFGLFNPYSVNAILSASPTIFLTFIYLSILIALHSFSDELAGMLLFLVGYQWEVGALFFLFILVFVVANRRWSVFTGFGMLLIVFMVVAFILNSSWFIPYARAILFDWRRGVSYSFGFTLSDVFPLVSLAVGRWLSIGVAVLLLFETILSVNEYIMHVTWVAFLSLALNPIMGFAIFPSNHVVLLPAFILFVALAWERWENKRALLSVGLLSFVFIFSYGIYFQSIYATSNLYGDLLKIIPPIMAIIALYWMRWWAVRPPRIWADQLGGRK